MERLKEIRQQRGLSQARLAELAGCSQQAVVDYEKGKSAPGGDVLIKLARVLQVNPEYLTGDSDDPRRDTRLPDEWVHEVEKLIGQGLTVEEIRSALDMYRVALRRLRGEDQDKDS